MDPFANILPESNRHVRADQDSDATKSSVGRKVIITIGIDAYENVTRLSHAKSDAKHILDFFLRPDIGFEELATCQSLFDQEATISSIKSLLNVAKQSLTIDDDLIVFFAGHGCLVKNPKKGGADYEGYIMPADGSVSKTETETPNNCLSINELFRGLDRLPARHILLILDACFAGSAATESYAPLRFVPENSGPENLSHAFSRCYITSSRAHEVAQDKSSFFTLMMDCFERPHRWLGEQTYTTPHALGSHLREQFKNSNQHVMFGEFVTQGYETLVIPCAKSSIRPTGNHRLIRQIVDLLQTTTGLTQPNTSHLLICGLLLMEEPKSTHSWQALIQRLIDRQHAQTSNLDNKFNELPPIINFIERVAAQQRTFAKTRTDAIRQWVDDRLVDLCREPDLIESLLANFRDFIDRNGERALIASYIRIVIEPVDGRNGYYTLSVERFRQEHQGQVILDGHILTGSNRILERLDHRETEPLLSPDYTPGNPRDGFAKGNIAEVLSRLVKQHVDAINGNSNLDKEVHTISIYVYAPVALWSTLFTSQIFQPTARRSGDNLAWKYPWFLRPVERLLTLDCEKNRDIANYKAAWKRRWAFMKSTEAGARVDYLRNTHLVSDDAYGELKSNLEQIDEGNSSVVLLSNVDLDRLLVEGNTEVDAYVADLLIEMGLPILIWQFPDSQNTPAYVLEALEKLVQECQPFALPERHRNALKGKDAKYRDACKRALLIYDPPDIEFPWYRSRLSGRRLAGV